MKGLIFPVAGLWTLLAGAPAWSQVIEIDSQGVATTYDGPTMFVGETAHRLQAILPATTVREDAYESAARAHGLPTRLLAAVAWQESRGASTAVSPKGAIGIMQLMPETARRMGVDPFDPAQNIAGGAFYLRQQLDRFGSVPLALAAYNAGPGAVRRYGGIPPYRETRAYVSAILARLGDEGNTIAQQPRPNALPIEVAIP